MSFRFHILLSIVILISVGKSAAQISDTLAYEEPLVEVYTSTILEDLLKVKLNGFAEIDHISFLKRESKDKIYSRNQALIHFNLDSKIGNKSRLFTSVEVREDLSNPSRNRVYLQEAYADVFFKRMDFRIGKQIITWGAADGINFTNNINPINLTDLLDLRYQTIGVLALKGSFYVKRWTFTGVIVPVFNPTVLPASDSPWSKEFSPVVPNPFAPGNVFQASYQYVNPDLPAKDIRSAQYAAKVATTVRKVDVSLSYYRGYNDLPITFNQNSVVLNADSIHIEIQPEYRPWDVIGADFSSVLGKFGLRGEAAYFITDNRNRKGDFVNYPYLQYALGLDRNFNRLSVLFQWLHQVTTHNQKFSNLDLNHIFQKSIMARIECRIGDYAKLSVKGIYNIDGEDFYIQPQLSYEIIGGLNLTLLSDILAGPSNSFFGDYRNNDRIQARIKYNF